LFGLWDDEVTAEGMEAGTAGERGGDIRRKVTAKVTSKIGSGVVEVQKKVRSSRHHLDGH